LPAPTVSKAAAAAVASPAAATSPAGALDAWTAQWVSLRRAQIAAEFESLSAAEQSDWVDRLRAHLADRGVHPSIRKRLDSHGWRHQLVQGEFLKFYKGPDWDKPTPQELLSIAAEQSSRRP
jgi:hypothetical protein